MAILQEILAECGAGTGELFAQSSKSYREAANILMLCAAPADVGNRDLQPSSFMLGELFPNDDTWPRSSA